MENSKESHLGKEGHSSEVLPSLIQAITANEVSGFDSVEENHDFKNQLKSKGLHPFGIEANATDNQKDACEHQRTHSISISMPPSPIEAHLQSSNGVDLDDNNPKTAASQTKKAKFYSQPMPKTSAFHPRLDKLKDHRYDSFKTWSGKLERQLSNLRGRKGETETESQTQQNREFDSVPVDRYFDALEGPELDTLRASEEIVLPKDKTWPFLLRFPISSFGICLGVSSQAIMWKALATSASTKFLNITPDVNLVLWFISVTLVLIVSSIYALKVIFYFEAVRREYYHPIRVNFFFAPWIALLFLAMGVPQSLAPSLHQSLWYILMTPICCLEIKIYGQWMSGGQRRLSKVANPSNHLSIVGNFVGALFGASMGLKEGPIFFFAVGLAHYIVLFVTLYQRLPTNETLPKELHPVFFLFVAAPSVASMAWATIQGLFDCGSRIAYFIAMFLYFSLAVRVNFFRGFRFSLAWWAYTFPMTGAAIATIRYSNVVTSVVTKSLTVFLCAVATLTVASLLVTTIIHAFVLRNLFPNDIAIAISERRPKTGRRWYHRRSGSSDRGFEQYLKYADSDGKDVEACVNASNCSNEELSDSVSNDVGVGGQNKVVAP